MADGNPGQIPPDKRASGDKRPGEDGLIHRDTPPLPAAAQRALAEAAARRREIDQKAATMPREIDGRGGLEPTRYDDWEIKGLTSDF